MLHKALRMISVFHDISQKGLAARLGIAPSNLCEIDSNAKQPTLQIL
jgi:DNA-binding Xre family transcriptional regulator